MSTPDCTQLHGYQCTPTVDAMNAFKTRRSSWAQNLSSKVVTTELRCDSGLRHCSVCRAGTLNTFSQLCSAVSCASVLPSNGYYGCFCRCVVSAYQRLDFSFHCYVTFTSQHVTQVLSWRGEAKQANGLLSRCHNFFPKRG